MPDWFYPCLVASILGIYHYLKYRHDMKPYRNRSCTGRPWKLRFPNSSKYKIRTFLECFVDGMAISSRLRLKFHPDDLVMDVYKTTYGGKVPLADMMECETFLENLSEEFDIELAQVESMWREDVTLGELFSKIQLNTDKSNDLHYAGA